MWMSVLRTRYHWMNYFKQLKFSSHKDIVWFHKVWYAPHVLFGIVWWFLYCVFVSFLELDSTCSQTPIHFDCAEKSLAEILQNVYWYSPEEHCRSFRWESNDRILSKLFISIDVNGEQKVFGFIEMLIKGTKCLRFYLVLWSKYACDLLLSLISLILNIMWLLYHFHIRALHLALSAKDRTTGTPTSRFVLQSHSKFVRNFTQSTHTANVLLTI